MPQFDSFNPILTSSPLLIALVCSFYKKVVTPLSSKSCNYPEKLRLHQPPSLTCSYTSTTHESLAMTKNNVEEDSYQKQVSIPSIFPKFDSSSIANHEMRSILEWLWRKYSSFFCVKTEYKVTYIYTSGIPNLSHIICTITISKETITN